MMSSMDSKLSSQRDMTNNHSKKQGTGRLVSILALAAAGAALGAVTLPVTAQTMAPTDKARSTLVAQQPTAIGQAIGRWEYLTAARNTELGFAAYAGFALKYPEFPKMRLLQIRAESALDDDTPSSEALVAYFDKHPPISNAAAARYALALSALERPEAVEIARAAWRGGEMSDPSEAYLAGSFGSQFTQDDHDARMDALLWQDEAEAAARQTVYVTPAKRNMFMARLALVEGKNPDAMGLTLPADAMSDPGYVYNLTRYYRKSGNMPAAISLLANRPAFSELPLDAENFVAEMLIVAKAASSSQTVQIAAKTDDLFPAGTDISLGSFRLRDKFTDLMWMGGTNALWRQNQGRTAARMFEGYGNAAKTPLTKAKGFYWAGRAMRSAAGLEAAKPYFVKAAQFPDQYYGQLALEAMGQTIPAFMTLPDAVPSSDEKAAFESDPLVRALRHMARNRMDWRTERAFFSAISEKAKTPNEMAMVGNLAKELGLEEMAVVAGATAPEHGLVGFERLAHPTVTVPAGTNWTMAHAIMRQESEFDQTRVSHAGARGMMQLMPGTAREQAGKLGMNYMSANLTRDTQYNIRLGDAYFKRMLDYYDGSYPLALGAYNAGPGRVNQWLRMNGDPRKGEIDYQTWIEKIPANFETRYYIMRVLGNAVAYDNMHPNRAPGGKPRSISYFLS